MGPWGLISTVIGAAGAALADRGITSANNNQNHTLEVFMVLLFLRRSGEALLRRLRHGSASETALPQTTPSLPLYLPPPSPAQTAATCAAVRAVSLFRHRAQPVEPLR